MIAIAVFPVLFVLTSSRRYTGDDPNLQGFFSEATLSDVLYGLRMVHDQSVVRLPIDGVVDVAKVSPDDIDFELYTKDNPEETYFLRIGDIETLRNSSFDSKRPTKIIVHGWMDSSKVPWFRDIRSNYLAVGDYNVICLNWSAGANREYLISAKLTRQVGEYLGILLEFLGSEGNLAFEDVHILGHSLGAHIAGFAGAHLFGDIGRITGMDPAAPAFERPRLKGPRDRLDPTDARFVDIIHTCAGTLGFLGAIGHADFYPNGGTFRQPGCPVFAAQYCSHDRSHRLMAESIVIPESFVAMRCASWKNLVNADCEDAIGIMGESLDPGTRGIFYLETNSRPPFGKSRAPLSPSTNV